MFIAVGFGFLVLLVLWYKFVYSVEPVSTVENSGVYELPTFLESLEDFHVIREKEFSMLRDVEKIFDTVLGCYPTYSRYSKTYDLKGFEMNGLPVLPGDRDDRLLQQEADRRNKIIDDIALYHQAKVNLKYHTRLLAYYESLEKRSQERVRRGLASIPEQIGFMEKVAKARLDVESWRARLSASQLSLIAYCRDGERDSVRKLLN